MMSSLKPTTAAAGAGAGRTPRAVFRVRRLWADLAARQRAGMSYGLLAERDLSRLYAAIRAEVLHLAPTPAEWRLLVQAYQRYTWGTDTIPYLGARLGEMLATGAATGTGTSTDNLGEVRTAELVGLSPMQSLAIYDALERGENLLPGEVRA